MIAAGAAAGCYDPTEPLPGSPAMSHTVDRLYDILIEDDRDGRVCADIPPQACTDVPGNFLVQLLAAVATKLGDSLSSPRLVLTWLLASLSAPVALVGLLVPVRQAGSLLPQIAIGGVLRQRPVRKGFWIAGSVVQGLAIAAIGGVALSLDGAAAGWAVLGLLALFSVARGVCSVTSKDLLGKTVPKTRRGRLSGLAATAAGLLTVGLGVWFAAIDRGELSRGFYAVLLAAAGGLWLLAAALMSRLREAPGATDGAGNALAAALASFRYLRDDAAFRRFVIARGLLAGTVLSMPFYVLLARQATDGRTATLGFFLVAGSVATGVSAAPWGWLADRSSRLTLVVAGTAAGLLGVVTFVVAGLALGPAPALWLYGALYLLLGVAHTGIRLGRKTYVVDLADGDRRAAYVALSNTLIGVLLLAGGGVGLLGAAVSERAVVLLFGVLGVAGGLLALGMPEVETGDGGGR